MQTIGLIAAAVVGQLPRAVQRLGKEVGRLLRRGTGSGELGEYLVFVAAAFAQEHVRRARHGEGREQKVRSAGRLPDVFRDVLGLGGNLRELGGVFCHRCAHPRLPGSTEASGKISWYLTRPWPCDP